MDWKREAKDKLRRYDAMRTAAINLPRQIRSLQVAACDYQEADQLMNNMAFRQELRWQLEQVKQWLDVTERAMGCLNREERQILNQLYVRRERGGVDSLCQDLQVERSTVYRRSDKALFRFATALYGA